jgi:hypothetical protein
LFLQWCGAVLVLLGFALVQVKVLSSTSRAYLVLNVVGSIVLAASAAEGRQWGFVTLNTTWGAVAAVSLLREIAGRRAAAPQRGDTGRS